MEKVYLNLRREDFETGDVDIDIVIHDIATSKNENNETLLKAIEFLIENIDLDVENAEESITSILYSFADLIGFNGWYDQSPNVTIKYEEDSEEGYVTEHEKINILISYLEMVKIRQNIQKRQNSKVQKVHYLHSSHKDK